MKKSLVFAMAMAMGITASAYAANPFSDVPQGHWAYDSVAELAAAGVVEGYGDGSYGGDKLMTRYEMAQIVAKAMAKGANVDALAAEFAEELDTLGVRVAALEKKADNVKISGEVRFRYVDKEICDTGDDPSGWTNHNADIRTRLWLKGQINEDWSYTGMIQNTQYLDDNSANDSTNLQRAYVQGKLGGMQVTAGRYNLVIADGNIYDTRADGVEVTYGNKIKLRGFAGAGTDAYDYYDDVETSYGDYAGVEISGAPIKNLDFLGGYVNFKDIYNDAGFFEGDKNENAIWYVGANYKLDNVKLSAMYLKGDANAEGIDEYWDGKSDGYVLGIDYKGAKASDVGSWGAWVKYYNQGAQTYLAHTTDAYAGTYDGTDIEGFKGYGVGVNYTVAKNAVVNVAYYDTEDIEYPDQKDKRLWTDVTFKF